MNWITTNIRLPEDMYMELKMQAARQRSSVAALVREKLANGKTAAKKRKVTGLMRTLDHVAKQSAKENKGMNMTQAVIAMRYEQ